MSDKKSYLKFTIQFNNKDPAHVRVADLLNEHGRQKAKYIVEAISFYETSGGRSENGSQYSLEDIKKIIYQVLKDRENKQHKPTIKAKTETVEPMRKEFTFDESSGFTDLDADSRNAIANAINMFKKK